MNKNRLKALFIFILAQFLISINVVCMENLGKMYNIGDVNFKCYAFESDSILEICSKSENKPPFCTSFDGDCFAYNGNDCFAKSTYKMLRKECKKKPYDKLFKESISEKIAKHIELKEVFENSIEQNSAETKQLLGYKYYIEKFRWHPEVIIKATKKMNEEHGFEVLEVIEPKCFAKKYPQVSATGWFECSGPNRHLVRGEWESIMKELDPELLILPEYNGPEN